MDYHRQYVNSDGVSNSLNRNSPMALEGRMLDSGRFRNLGGGIFGTITSSISSGGDNQVNQSNMQYVFQTREVKTHYP